MKIIVFGNPVAKARARTARWGTYTPAKTKNYEAKVADAAKKVMENHDIIYSACKIDVVAYMQIPTSWSKLKRYKAIHGQLLPITKPDGDNILKSASDGCNGIVYNDDNLIVEWSIKKIYSEKPRLEIEIIKL